MLAHYARTFRTVEINHTFRRVPTPSLLSGWAGDTPPGFRFALKAPQRITHILRLRNAGDLTTEFCRVARTLGPKLGPLLFQLPPSLRVDVERLGDFLAALPPRIEAAVEFRHPSWFSDGTYALLERHRAALCIADAEVLTTPAVATAPFGYLRLRRSEYGDPDLAAWAARVGETRRWKRVYVYFKHEDSGRGPALAREFLDRLA
jgi:uncharacterized protein YecE (DUF72 family)